MEIVRCDDRHREEWNRFVEAHSFGSFYHLFEWREINASRLGHDACYLGAFEAGRLVGIFPIVQVKSRLFGNIACSLPFVNYGGPCGNSEEIEQRLIDEGARVADEWRADYLEIRSQRKHGDRMPTSEHKVSMTVDLNADPDVLWKGYDHGHRKDIKRGYRGDVVVRFGTADLLDDFYGVLCETWRDIGTPIYSKSYIDAVVATFPHNVSLCVVYREGEPAAASFSGHHRGIMEGLWLGIRTKFRNDYVGYVLYWELLKKACESGMSRFHLGRSTTQSGSEAFKKKWKANPTQLYWQYHLRTRSDIPQLNVNNPKYRLAINAWRRLPVPVTQIVGPALARSIP